MALACGKYVILRAPTQPLPRLLFAIKLKSTNKEAKTNAGTSAIHLKIEPIAGNLLTSLLLIFQSYRNVVTATLNYL